GPARLAAGPRAALAPPAARSPWAARKRAQSGVPRGGGRVRDRPARLDPVDPRGAAASGVRGRRGRRRGLAAAGNARGRELAPSPVSSRLRDASVTVSDTGTGSRNRRGEAPARRRVRLS